MALVPRTSDGVEVQFKIFRVYIISSFKKYCKKFKSHNNHTKSIHRAYKNVNDKNYKKANTNNHFPTKGR